MKYQVYFQSIHSICLDEDTLSKLHPERRSRLFSYRKQEDRMRCAAAGLLLWEHIYQHDFTRCSISRNPYGKPILSNGDYFNLSHTGSLAMLVVHNNPIGCDLQVPSKAILSRHVFHPHELQCLQALPEGPQRDRLFLRLWTAKEAFLKAIGTGLSGAASSRDLSSGDFYDSETDSLWHFDYLTPPGEPDYLACICTKGCRM